MSLPQRDEEFKVVPNFAGYCASRGGRLFSSLRGTWRPVKPFAAKGKSRRPHLWVTLWFDAVVNGEAVRVRKPRRLDALVAAAFLGPRPPGMMVQHIDGNKRNCKVDNLKYATFTAVNAQGKIKIRGSNHYAAKLDAAKVVAIRQSVDKAIREGVPIPWVQVAAVAGVTVENCKAVARGKTWVDVDAGVPPWVPGPVVRFDKDSPRPAKLTLAEIQQIRDRLAAHESIGSVHKSFPQVTWNTIYKISANTYHRRGL